jgi:hypothetical protein
MRANQTLDWDGRILQVTIAALPSFVSDRQTALPEFVLAFAVVTVFIIAVLIGEQQCLPRDAPSEHVRLTAVAPLSCVHTTSDVHRAHCVVRRCGGLRDDAPLGGDAATRAIGPRAQGSGWLHPKHPGILCMARGLQSVLVMCVGAVTDVGCSEAGP